MAFDPDAYLAEGGGVETATSFDPDAYLGTQQPAEEEGFLRQAADIPVNIFKGGVTGVRMVTDVFGAANPISKSLAGVEDYMDTLLSAQAKQDQQEIARILKDAEDKGVLDQVVAGVEAFSVAPADTLANAFGTMIPVLATGLAGSVARLAPVAIKGVQLGMGFAQGVGTAKGEIYNAVYSELENQGYDPETASQIANKAQAYNGKNLDQILISGGLGAAAASTGAEKILTNVITKAGGKVTGGAIAKAIKGGITEGVPEAVQGGQEKLATNIALQREGVDVPTMRGVVAQATMEGVAGLGMGAAVGPLEPSLPDDVKEQRDIERDAEKVARELSVDPNDTNARGIVNETNRLEQKIQNNQVLLNGMEPTSREHQRLSLEIAEDQKNLAALKGAVDKLSEPIAAAEAEQARLAREIAAPVEEAVPAEPAAEVAAPAVEAAPVEPTAVAEAPAPTVQEGLTVPPTEEAVTPPVEPTAAVEEAPIEPVAEAPAITPAPVEEVEFAELRNLMERRGQAQGKVKGVKFSKKDEARYNELLPKYRSQLLETITPETDPVVWKDIEGNDIKVSQKGTFYTVENGRVRTGPAFQSEGFIKDVSPQPVSAAVVESNNVPLPEGYTKQGDLYVYQPTEAPTPAAPTPAAPVEPAKPIAPKEVLDEIRQYPDFFNKISGDQSLAFSDVARYLSFRGLPKTIDSKIRKEFSRGGRVSEIESAILSEREAATKKSDVESAVKSVLARRGESEEIDSAINRYELEQSRLFAARQESKGRVGVKWADDALASKVGEAQKRVRAAKDALAKLAQPTTAPAAPAEAAPTAISVGNRIKLGKSPQTYTIEEVIPQSEAEKELGEQYYSVRNEKTGEVQTVEAKDLKPVKAKGVRKMAAQTRNEEYMRLAQNPEANREQLQRMVDEAAKNAGYDSPRVYHGSISNIEIFDTNKIPAGDTQGSYFTDNKSYAATRGEPKSFFLKIENPASNEIEFEAGSLAENQTQKPRKGETYRADDGRLYLTRKKSGDFVKNKLESQGYDGVVREITGATTYIAFSPSQIKSADPVTYDDAGNVIPLEERFQPTSPDIRREAATRVKDESLVVPEADRYTFEQAEAEARKLFGGMPEGFVIVNDSVDPEYEFKAGYEPESGDIILNLAYIRKGESVRNLIAHELGHYAAGDPEIRAKLQEFLDALPATTRSRIERFVERFYNEDTGDMRLEEKQVRAFVQMLKAGDQRNAFQKLLDAIKKWLNDNLGTNFQPTDMDAAAILSGAINRYKSGEKIAREDGEMREAKVERSEDVKKDIAIAEKIQSVVNDTISKMPQDQARDYNAFVNEGKSEAQIAEENNTSVSQVRTNIVRGKKAVGDAIKKAKIDTKAKPENVVLEWTTSAAKKYLTKEGDLPGGTFQNWVKRNAKLAREAEEARQATQDFYEGLRKLYKINKIKFILDGLSSIPPEDVARFNDALAGEIPISDMPTEIQEPLTRMRQHIDAMSSELIATGQLPEYLEAKAMNNLGVYLTRSYKIFSDPKWINKIPQEKLTAARNFLYQQQSKTDPNFTIEDADRKLEQMLNDWAGERGMEGKRGGRLGAKDLSVMMTRSEVPKQLRDVMGENTNVIFNYANTIAKISRFVADQQFLDAVKKEGAGKFLFTKDAAPKGFNTLIAPEESRTMAPLSGLRTTPEIAKAFEEFGKAYDAKANPFLYAFGWLNAVGKANLTVGSLFTQARNIIGQPFFFLANGHADLRAINREVERIMKSKGLSKDKARNELVKMAAGEGLVNENAYAGELKEAFEQIGLKTFEDMDADEFSRQFSLLRLFKKGTQGAQKVYQKTDELGKLIGWLNETNRIQKMNPSMSREDAMSIAAERTRNTYPTYSQGSEALRLFRRQPFFGPFATFFYETFRTTYWNTRYAFEDINSGTEAGKQEGIKRLAGTMAQIAIGAYLVNAISAMMAGIGDQEEEDVRRMLPPWAANASLVWFPKTKDGVYDFINFSSLNPYNALSDPFVTMMSGFSRGEDPTDIFINAAGTFLSPFTSEQPVTAATVDALRNVTERGTKVYNEEDDLGTKTSKILLHIFGKAFTPGTIDRLRKRIIPAIYGETVGTRAPAPYKEIGAEFTGVRFENLDMRQAFQNKAWEFSKAQNDSERIFRDVATRRRRVTEEEQVGAYRRAEESRYQNWQEMYRNYMAVRRAGASKEEAVRLMTDIKISKREASYIARGKYVPYEVSDEVRRRSKLNGNVVPLQEIKAIAKEMPRVLEDVQ